MPPLMKSYHPTIGLEIHAELNTVTKLFCSSKNDSNELRPNVNICPICMGYPGVLPVLNAEAVWQILRIGAAVGGNSATYAEFDRKNYFYPDIPKGYQISQYKYPLITGGSLLNIAITRIHLEEDTARSMHDKGEYSLVDFNRAGVPLMELVTEPVIHTAEDAAAFAKELQLLLKTLRVGNANLEKGEMRIEANISVSDSETLGTKVEVKNLNSFRAVEQAITYEIKRHSDLLAAGEKVVQETRGWDEYKQQTFSQRLKEESHDYRYFPDPDVPKLYLTEIPAFSNERVRASLPELPMARRKRYVEELGLRRTDAEIFLNDEPLGVLFENVVRNSKDETLLQAVANYLTSDLIGLLKGKSNREEIISGLEAAHLIELVTLVKEGVVSSRGAKDILGAMIETKEAPTALVAKLNVRQESDTTKLKELIGAVIKENPSVVNDYKAGKSAALQFLVGAGMKASKGSANPALLRTLLQEELS